MISLEGEKDGIIQKWTNYWTGWQPRWLVLSDGILSYYNSEDEVQMGCRASIKLSACDIHAYPTDNTRFDVIVKNEQRWYLKTGTAAERQAWLIALGSSKASNSSTEQTASSKGHEAAVSELRSSINEVRLFCDLLLQQTVSVKEEAMKSSPDTHKLSDSSALLSTTCDTFLATLGRCLSLAETTLVISPVVGHMLINSPLHPIGDGGESAVPKIKPAKHKKRGGGHHHRPSLDLQPSPSASSSIHNTPSSSTSPSFHAKTSSSRANDSRHVARSLSVTKRTEEAAPQFFPSPGRRRSKSISETPSPATNNGSSPPDGGSESSARGESSADGGELVMRNHYSSAVDGADDADDQDLLTFFSAMLHSYSDIVLQEDGGIPTGAFLAACEGILPFFATIGSKAFAPVKMDFMGNISKLKTKHASNTEQFTTLQAMIEQEIRSSTTKVRNSATDALMWLKRGLRFIQRFLVIFKEGERDLTSALNMAYAQTLKVYHGWVVKGIFALAVKAAPYPDDFVRALSACRENADDTRFLDILLKDIDQYTTAMEVVLSILDHFYAENSLDSNAVV